MHGTLRRLGRRVMTGARSVALVLAATWGTLAIYYSNLPWHSARVIVAAAFAAFSVWALLTRRPRARWVFLALVIAVIAWEVSIPPSHDRSWRADVAVMPQAVIDGDRVRISGVRDFSWRGTGDFSPRYVEREVSLAHLSSMDFFVSYWGAVSGPVAHTFLSFNFDNAEPVSISIEARPEQGEGYDPLASMFKQFELIYVVGQERDIVGVRTTYRGEAVYVYRIRSPADGVRRLFLLYMSRINELAQRPEWYSLLKSNCTLNIMRYARNAGWTATLDVREYLNGWVDRFLYGEGVLNTAVSFEDLRARARIQETLQAGERSSDFSRRIRKSLSGGD